MVTIFLFFISFPSLQLFTALPLLRHLCMALAEYTAPCGATWWYQLKIRIIFATSLYWTWWPKMRVDIIKATMSEQKSMQKYTSECVYNSVHHYWNCACWAVEASFEQIHFVRKGLIKMLTDFHQYLNENEILSFGAWGNCSHC